MPAHSVDLKNAQDVLRILLSLIIEAKGELRFKASTYDSLDRGRLITVDFDRKKGQILLRATSDFASAVNVAPEAHQWTQPADVAPMQRERIAATRAAEEHSIPSDEQLAEIEERLARERQVAQDVQDGVSPMRVRVRK